MDVLTVLKEQGIIDDNAVAAIADEVAKTGESVETRLRERGVAAEVILDAQGTYYQMPTRNVSSPDAVAHEALEYVPEESARHYKFVPIDIVDGVLEVGTIDPDNLEAIEALNFITARTNIPYKLFIISEENYNAILEAYKGLTGEVGKALGELGTTTDLEVDKKDEGDDSLFEKSKDGGNKIKEDAPVTKIVSTIVRYAVDGRASDIHIEPTRTDLRVRFRVDGVMYQSLKLPKTVERAVVARIKVLASLKLDERRKPQDGRFSTKIDEKRIDFRVSTFPTYHGEKVVMRILDREKQEISLNTLGLSDDHIAMIKRALERPYGLIIISGPTGAGKSTTLYGMLQELNRDEANVVSLEDPVEYDVPGVSQSQVRPEIGYTFANGLRSILRQDPDIIMVGEIRDKETAQLAIQAALTGHLVLSTLHTNNAIGVVPRLVDMGVDPYLIAPTLVLSIAQRLVRKRCDDAGNEMPYEGHVKEIVEKEFKNLPEKYRSVIPDKKTIYGIAPSPGCPNGTRGRIGVFELLPDSKELERTILNNPTEEAIFDIARAQGMLTMKEDAIIKMLTGAIPFEELNALGADIVI